MLSTLLYLVTDQWTKFNGFRPPSRENPLIMCHSVSFSISQRISALERPWRRRMSITIAPQTSIS